MNRSNGSLMSLNICFRRFVKAPIIVLHHPHSGFHLIHLSNHQQRDAFCPLHTRWLFSVSFEFFLARHISGIASPKIWGEPKNFFWAKMFDFTRITLFCLEKRLSKHKMTIFSKNFLGGVAPLATPMRHIISKYHDTILKPEISFRAVRIW